MTRRRWIADTFTPAEGHPTHAALEGEQALHLARVLRAQPGQVFDVVAGGFLHRAEVTGVSAERVDFVLHEELQADNALPLHLYLAVFKFDHFEWAVEEKRRSSVSPRSRLSLARRTEKHLAQAAAKRVERWRRIAHEASQQARRVTVPDVANPTPLKSALALASHPVCLLLSETEQSLTIMDALGQPPASTDDTLQECTHAIAIGPEGGWTADEMAIFTAHQWLPVTLGPRILRAETAAIAAISIASALLG